MELPSLTLAAEIIHWLIIYSYEMAGMRRGKLFVIYIKKISDILMTLKPLHHGKLNANCFKFYLRKLQPCWFHLGDKFGVL